jgi:hypothetical protein
MKKNQVEGYIDDVEISHVSITISKKLKSITELDLGSVTLSCKGREYMMDISDSCWCIEKGYTEITCGLKTVDEDNIFEDCKFDLTGDDLFSSDISGTIFVGDEDKVTEGKKIKATLYVNGECIKAIDLNLE